MNIVLPELGEGIDSVEITDILTNKGSSVKVDDIILVVESDKASMEIPVKESGTVTDVLVSKGDSIKPGDTIIVVDSKENQTDKTKDAELKPILEETLSQEDTLKETISEKNVSEEIITKPDKSDSSLNRESSTKKNKSIINFDNSRGVIATPSVRKLARELGCNLNQIIGSGKNNRITKEDVLEHVKITLKNDPVKSNEDSFEEKKETIPKEISNPQIDENRFLEFGSVEKISFNKIRSITAKRMINAWTSIPHVTHFDEIEIDHILNLKKDIELITKSKKVSILTFITHALVKTLSVMKRFNSTADIDNEILIIKNYINLGIAVDTPGGLVVPNIKNIEKKSIKDINSLIIKLSNKARSKKLTPRDLSQGTFTISSLGGIGGRFFTPIINHPEVSIMGISQAYTKIKLDSNNFPIKAKVLPFSLSYDHRVIDGAEAARFCNLFKDNLKNLSSV